MSRQLAIAALLTISLASPAHAVFRSPQVPVMGTALQDLLNGLDQTIAVETEQRPVAPFQGIFITRPAAHFYVRPFAGRADALLLRHTSLIPPPIPDATICPAGLADGWFTEVVFDSNTGSVTVMVFDDASVLQSTSTHPTGFGGFWFVTSGPGGDFSVNDPDNPGQRAHVLAYHANGPWIGTWLCGENQTEANGADFDFADAVFLLEYLIATPVQRTSWGTLKNRFR